MFVKASVSGKKLPSTSLSLSPELIVFSGASTRQFDGSTCSPSQVRNGGGEHEDKEGSKQETRAVVRKWRRKKLIETSAGGMTRSKCRLKS